MKDVDLSTKHGIKHKAYRSKHISMKDVDISTKHGIKHKERGGLS